MKLTPEEAEKLKKELPRAYWKLIYKEIDGALEERGIQQVVNGKRGDHHGVIAAAARIIKAIRKEKNKTKEFLNQL